MSLSKALFHIHRHQDSRMILTIPYEHSKSPRVQLLILNELDGTYLFLSHLNGALKFLESGRSYSIAGFDFQRDLVR